MSSLNEILLKHPVWRGGALVRTDVKTVSTGFADLNRELPGGGWPEGGLTEILGMHEGVGELQLVLPALVALSSARQRIVWLAPPHLPYAPGLAAAGVDLEYLTVVRTPGRRDTLWAAEQVLRAGTCLTLLVWFRDVRYAELRRLAVAAESSRAFVALFRPQETVHESSPACLRIVLEARSATLVVRIVKRRGAIAAAPVSIAIRRPVHAVAGTSFSAPSPRSPSARPCLA